jgi:multiple sugar transport system substrate-binding protein
VDTPEAREAVDFMLEMFDAGYADPNFNYTAAQEAFLTGEAAFLLNGTWAVDQYRREADFDYMAMDFPAVYDEAAVWANSHMWVLPKQQNDAKYEAGMVFLSYLYEQVFDWAAGTGHLAPRSSVLESEELQNVPQRQNYAGTADTAKLVPSIENWQAVEDILKEEIESTWLTGKSVSAALADADSRVNSVLQD